ncbi:FkbM family methyltransferase [Pontibacter sp. G13]|uniref:FkbM family methyltransferase n=1 Tax=Pontibacter sp. G13 TaxID=3074898 RepID=UPI0028891913|nr:FkbM family methyltransferase [Pontibacter sp. G13]WNJ19230.1 FkbM family methyltransferase [Pontibacter sp. G13]
MKKALQAILQRILGFDRYLFWFSLFKINTIRFEGHNKEGDFLHFLGMLNPNDHVLDIGANIGIMSVLLAKRCPEGQIHAFEPVEENLKALRKVVAHHDLPQVHIHPIALGKDVRKIHMHMPILQGVRMQGLSHVQHETIEGYESDAVQYEVQQTSLDEWLSKYPHAINAIKMDVENYEQFVLEGGMESLRTHRPIIYCELWDNENRANCMDILERLGYSTQVLIKDMLVPFEAAKHPHHNFFFIPNPA